MFTLKLFAADKNNLTIYWLRPIGNPLQNVLDKKIGNLNMSDKGNAKSWDRKH